MKRTQISARRRKFITPSEDAYMDVGVRTTQEAKVEFIDNK